MQPIQKLPSIQSMLEGISLEDEKIHSKQPFNLGHRRHASESIFRLHEDLPVPLEPKIHTIPTSTPTICSRLSHLQKQHSSHAPRNLHSRSFSDYTHPYPTTSPPRATGNNSLAPLHRRAISTNTLDLILQPLVQRPHDSPCPSPSPPVDQGHAHLKLTSPPSLCTSTSTTTSTTHSPTEEKEGYFSDEPDQRPSASETHETKANNSKYSCPYCQKGFSRPSSLRIHTYSHTGERPFECPESGCSRKFSVQSNMRRHLRVHRLGRPLKRNGGLISPADRAQLINKPIAAKPVVTTHSSWVGVATHPI